MAEIEIKWVAIFFIIASLHGLAYRSLEKILFERSITVRETDLKYFTCLSDILLYEDFIKNDNLSGGERRKFSIDTALKKSADVLIMDEPVDTPHAGDS